ncbi:MAG: hypothetical protein HY552_04070 [Elusimicrobia bacterium]|nr:hypothetical protein [Elusimicrobiota bacterium]
MEGLSCQKVFALAFDDAAEGVCVPLSAMAAGTTPGINFSSNMDPSSREACRHACGALAHLGILSENPAVYFYVPSYIRKVTGPSIGLAAALAVMRMHGIVENEAPIWATGEVTPFGSVLPVGGMKIKLSNPLIKRGKIFIPQGYEAPPGLDVRAVKNIEEVRQCVPSPF